MEAPVKKIARTAQRMRRDIIEMLAEAGSGHPGGSLSATDIVAVLFFHLMNHDASWPERPDRDRFVLSKGHAAPVLYAALAEAGYFGREHLSTLRKLGSMLQGHPDSSKTPGVEVSTGSLGQGLAIANGIALALRLDGNEDPRVFCLLGDGELQEGEVWEAAMFAAHHDLSNVIAFVDHNELQIDGACTDVLCLGDIAVKFSAFGWRVFACDGHDIRDLIDTAEQATQAARAHRSPAVVVCRTVKGKGVSFMENAVEWHGKAPNAEQKRAALAELGFGEEAR